jgi:anhydro-N-acetylmuramic acid kinase
LIAGAMSGTSADGVDVAITRIEGAGVDMEAALVHHHHRPYEPALQREIFSFRGGTAAADLARLARLGRGISLAHAAAVNEALAGARLSASDLAAVAAHGQTLYHAPPNTIQWFDPSIVAGEVGCAVVSDFRRADCAAGGQGAPLVPFADYVLFRHAAKNRVLLNIGGIANITWLPAGCAPEQVLAFDTGPGNCISDWLCRTRDPQGPGFDADGRRALLGQWSTRIVNQFMRTEYFDQPAPKSTDGPAMIATFQQVAGADLHSASLEDLFATASICTGTTIYHALQFTLGLEDIPFDVIASGGGTKNQAIMRDLAGVLADQNPAATLLTTDDLGIPSDAKEAVAFALLAAATLDGLPSNVPSVTGARRSVVLGSITPRP